MVNHLSTREYLRVVRYVPIGSLKLLGHSG